MSGAQCHLFAGRRPLGSLAVDADKSILCMIRFFFFIGCRLRNARGIAWKQCASMSCSLSVVSSFCFGLFGERTEQLNIFPVFHTQTEKVSIHCRAWEGESINDRDTCSRKILYFG